jgi:hypothetical protein
MYETLEGLTECDRDKDFWLDSLLAVSVSVSPQWQIRQIGGSDTRGSAFSNFLDDCS